MRLKKTFTYYTDPSHGWIKVPKWMIQKYCPEKEFSFSYMRKCYAYLEEDYDAVLFLDAYCNAHDLNRLKEFKFIDKHTNKRSKIRNYDAYRSTLNQGE